MKRALMAAYPVILLLVLWEGMVRTAGISPLILPSATAVAREATAQVIKLTVLAHAGTTLGRALTGFSLAIAVGTVAGFLMGRNRPVEAVLGPLFSVSYPVPKISLYPIFIFVFGLGNLSKVSLVFLECLYPIVMHTYYGTRGVDRLLLWSARNMEATNAQIFRKIVIPAAFPHIFSGIRIALPVSLVLAVITEMIGSNDGLGFFIVYSSASFLTARVFVGIAMAGLLGFALDATLQFLRARLLPWERGIRLVA